MLKRRLGDEDALFAELTKQYSAEEEPAVAALVRLNSASLNTELCLFMKRRRVKERATPVTPKTPRLNHLAVVFVTRGYIGDLRNSNARPKILFPAITLARDTSVRSKGTSAWSNSHYCFSEIVLTWFAPAAEEETFYHQ